MGLTAHQHGLRKTRKHKKFSSPSDETARRNAMKKMILVTETTLTHVLVDVDEDVDAEILVQAIHGNYGIESKSSYYESDYRDVTERFTEDEMEAFADISFGKDEYNLEELEREQDMEIRKRSHQPTKQA